MNFQLALFETRHRLKDFGTKEVRSAVWSQVIPGHEISSFNIGPSKIWDPSKILLEDLDTTINGWLWVVIIDVRGRRVLFDDLDRSQILIAFGTRSPDIYLHGFWGMLLQFSVVLNDAQHLGIHVRLQ